MISRLEFLITEMVVSLRRHPAMAFAAITCVAAAMFVAGLVGLMILNARFAVDSAITQMRFEVFFHPETSRQEAWSAYKKIVALEPVAQAEFVAREKAWDRLKKDDPSFAREIGYNPYPDMVNVQANDLRDIPVLRRELQAWPEVKKVTDEPKVSSFLETSRHMVSMVGLGVGIILIALALVIIHHTIELTIYARRKEIHIMALVGATPSTVAMPFLLEGMLYGLLGAGVAVGLLHILYHFTIIGVQTKYGAHLLANSPLLGQGMLVILGAGAMLGLIASTGSMLKYLKNPRSRITNA